MHRPAEFSKGRYAAIQHDALGGHHRFDLFGVTIEALIAAKALDEVLGAPISFNLSRKRKLQPVWTEQRIEGDQPEFGAPRKGCVEQVPHR